jgi:hypothetical protein
MAAEKKEEFEEEEEESVEDLDVEKLKQVSILAKSISIQFRQNSTLEF